MNKPREAHPNHYRKVAFLALCLLLSVFSTQAQEVKASINRDTIKIGEQITYKMEVEANKDDKVVFPQGQSFLPLEVIDSTAIDTFLIKDQYKLVREYPLTQFDSGAYTIPRQTLIVNGEGVYTDSFPVLVNDVMVDTTKQDLYPIKPALNIKPSVSIPNWVWWILGVLILVGVILLIIKTRKKIIERKKELPPYEKAIQTLQLLDEARELEEGRMKTYYSRLSETIKRYMDEKIDARALESTTDEFIFLLKHYKKEKQIYLKEQVIDEIEAILKRADLVKFAGIQTDKLTAREDRKSIEDNINAFDKAIPEPTEEEKIRDENYRLEKERKEQRRRLYIKLAIGVVILLIAGGVFVNLKGVEYIKGLMGVQTTEKLLRADWTTSEYGSLGMTLTTPEVLLRQMDTVELAFPGKSKTEERFAYGSPESNLYVKVTNIRFKKETKIDSINVDQMLDKAFEETELSTMTFKDQTFKTSQNKEGQKVTGTFSVEHPTGKSTSRKAYTFLLFNERGGLQQLLITYNQDDENGEAIEERVINSVHFNTEHDG